MSEIKGQILGIVLVLVIFGAVSAAIATVFNTTTSAVTEKSKTIVSDTEGLLTVSEGE